MAAAKRNVPSKQEPKRVRSKKTGAASQPGRKSTPSPATSRDKGGASKPARKATARTEKSSKPASKPSLKTSAITPLTVQAQCLELRAAGRDFAWLMKSEPETYSIEDLERDGETPWEGVRNYHARNFMRDLMRVGDLVLFYHSNASPAGVVGLGRVATPAQVDTSALDPGSPYFDPKSDPETPRWCCVRVAFVEKWAQPVTLETIKGDLILRDMLVAQTGARLSIQPVLPVHVERLLKLAGKFP